jgi:hypothetical protein
MSEEKKTPETEEPKIFGIEKKKFIKYVLIIAVVAIVVFILYKKFAR